MAKTKKATKVGRPRNPAPLVMVNFKADPSTVAAIDRLTAAIGGGVLNGGRSLAIRRALLESAARLDDEDGE